MQKAENDSLNESEGQMVLRIAKKFAILIIFILMFDVLLDLFSSLIDFIIGIGHFIFEFFEYTLEVLLEHFLNSNHYESEVLIINFMMLVILYGVFRLCFFIPTMYTRTIRRIKATYLRRKRKNHAYWQSLSLTRKTESIATYVVGVFCILFLLTL